MSLGNLLCWSCIKYPFTENEEFNEGQYYAIKGDLSDIVAITDVTSILSIPKTACVQSSQIPHIGIIVLHSMNEQRIQEELLSVSLISSLVLEVELLFCEFLFTFGLWTCYTFPSQSILCIHTGRD